MTTIDAWSTNRLALGAVDRHATDPNDRRLLLDMIGLTDSDGRLLPDDTRCYDVDANSPETGSTIGWRAIAPEPLPHPEQCTAPAGLRALGAA